jgi:hypothetical protein
MFEQFPGQTDQRFSLKARRLGFSVLGLLFGAGLGAVSGAITDAAMTPDQPEGLAHEYAQPEIVLTTDGDYQILQSTDAYMFGETGPSPLDLDNSTLLGMAIGSVAGAVIVSGFYGIDPQKTEIIQAVQRAYDKVFIVVDDFMPQ